MEKNKYMLKSERGVLSVEASIALSVLLFFVFSLMDFGTIFRAQNYMAHGTIQTAKSLAYKAYEYETIEFSSTEAIFSLVSALYNNVMGEKTEEQNLKLAWRTNRIAECVEMVFYNTAGKDESSVKNQMETYGIEVVSVDFKKSQKTENDVVVDVSYKVKLKYPFFHFSEVTLRQQAKSRLWS